MSIPNHQITLQLAPDTAHAHCLATMQQARALAASSYPDALNFLKPGISAQEYTAMTNFNNCLLANT